VLHTYVVTIFHYTDANIFTGIGHKIHHPTISMSFLDDVGGILTVPSQHYVCESSVSITGPPDVTDDDTGISVYVL